MFASVLEGAVMNYEIVSLPAMTVVGQELKTTWVNNECYSAIPAFWDSVKKSGVLSSISNKKLPEVVLGLYTNYSPDFSLNSGYYSLIIGCPVLSADYEGKDLVVKEIPAAKYAVFTAHGPFATGVVQAWMAIWQDQTLKRTFTYDFEWYDAQSTDDQNSVVKIYVAIQ